MRIKFQSIAVGKAFRGIKELPRIHEFFHRREMEGIEIAQRWIEIAVYFF